jgi:hypothetical protein
MGRRRPDPLVLPVQRVPGENERGGSLALAVELDAHGEEIWLDLKEFWNFDLVEFIGGRCYGSVTLIFTMMRQLPEGSRYAAIMSAPMDDDEARPEPEIDPATEAAMQRRYWTSDRKLKAMEINAIRDLTLVTGHWEKGKEPKFPVIGPPEWRGETAAKKKPATTNDVLRALGWNGATANG